MNLVYATDSRLEERGGALYGRGLSYELLRQRYLHEFDGMVLLARVIQSSALVSRGQRVDGPGVEVVRVPDYHGASGLFRSMRGVSNAVRDALSRSDAIIARVPSSVGTILLREAGRQGRPYGVEVVGDPADVFGRGAFLSPGRALIRVAGRTSLRRQCRRASAAAYVTKSYLQERYPTKGWATSFSSIDLGPEDFAAEPQLESLRNRILCKGDSDTWQLVFVGSLSQPHKGGQTLLRAVRICLQDGFRVALSLLGDGRYQRELQELAARLSLTDRVRFRDYVPHGMEYFEALDGADLFVLPSLAEGLPRVLVEAMARGLPCIATAVGGIPELLCPDDLVRRGDPTALADGIARTLNDPARMVRMSLRNYGTSLDYERTLLEPRRRAFYRAVARATPS